MDNVKFTGVMTALASPLDGDGTVREEVLRRLLEWQVGQGITGFYLCGGTGEGVVMRPDQRMRLAEIAKSAVGGRARLIAQVGAVDLRTAVALARHAGEIELDGVSSVPPFFYGYGPAEIARYYATIAEASGLPLLMYATPMAGTPLTCEVVDRLMDIPHMIGLKWTSYDYYNMHRIKGLRGGDINVLNGADECLLCGLAMGADGGIGTTYNVMPKVIRQIYDSFVCGELAAAQRAQFKANRLIEVLLRFGPVPTVKVMLGWMGYNCGHCTPPLKRLDGEEEAALRQALDELAFESEYL